MSNCNRSTLTVALVATTTALAFTSAEATDFVTITVQNANGSQTVEVPMDEIKVGESRQLASSSGQPAVITRTSGGLVLEVAGKRTEIDLPDHGQLKSWHHHVADGKVEVIELDKEGSEAGTESRKQRVMVIRHEHDGAMDEAEINALVADIETDLTSAEDGERVIVKRRIDREVKTPSPQ